MKLAEPSVSMQSLLLAFWRVITEPDAGRLPLLLDTVSVAALLVTLPAELLIATVNCVPLSELVLAGVA